MAHVRRTFLVQSSHATSTKPAPFAHATHSPLVGSPASRPSRQIGSSNARRCHGDGSSPLSHAHTTKRPPGRRTRKASLKNRDLSPKCAKLSIATTASNDSEGSPLSSQSRQKIRGESGPLATRSAYVACARDTVNPTTRAPNRSVRRRAVAP